MPKEEYYLDTKDLPEHFQIICKRIHNLLNENGIENIKTYIDTSKNNLINEPRYNGFFTFILNTINKIIENKPISLEEMLSIGYITADYELYKLRLISNFKFEKKPTTH